MWEIKLKMYRNRVQFAENRRIIYTPRCVIYTPKFTLQSVIFTRKIYTQKRVKNSKMFNVKLHAFDLSGRFLVLFQGPW